MDKLLATEESTYRDFNLVGLLSFHHFIAITLMGLLASTKIDTYSNVVIQTTANTISLLKCSLLAEEFVALFFISQISRLSHKLVLLPFLQVLCNFSGHKVKLRFNNSLL